MLKQPRSAHLAKVAWLALALGWVRCAEVADDIAHETTPAYQLAQGCFRIAGYGDGRWLVADGTTYRLAADTEAAEAFYLKPSGLGEFLLSDREGKLLGSSQTALVRADHPTDQTVWRVQQLEIRRGNDLVDNAYTLIPQQDQQRRLTIVDENIALAAVRPSPLAADIALRFVEQPAGSCTPYPEASRDADVSASFDEPKDPSAAVVGFADVHTHIAFPATMAGVAMPSQVFHPFGIAHALGDCADVHGEDGAWDALETQNSAAGASGHQTAGYPDFPYWPNRQTITHVTTYHRWLERAYLSGLRLIVSHVTGNPTFCDLLSTIHPDKKQGGCNGIQAVAQQTAYLYRLQDYIDAQAGGPGKGWFRIVTSPADARAAIANNQLAVILGIEHGELFNCRESTDCTEAHVDKQLESVYELGIRAIFPMHRFDNAFGGTRIAGGANGAWMNLTSRLSTSSILWLIVHLAAGDPIDGHFWELEPCPSGVDGVTDIRNMQEFADVELAILKDVAAGVPGLGATIGNDFDAFFTDKLDPWPDYAAFQNGESACNAHGLNPIGRYLINRLIDKKMIIEVDHMSYSAFSEAMAIVKQRGYSGVVSSHRWIENKPEVRKKIFELGGIVAAGNGSASGYASRLKQYQAEMAPYGFANGICLGTDIQGVTSQPGATAGTTISYPFTSYDGLVSFTPPKTGSRQFDYASEGMAHYGLLAEWVEDLRLIDQNDTHDLLAGLMGSAEAYLQMWERANGN